MQTTKDTNVASRLTRSCPRRPLMMRLAPFDGFHETTHAVTGTCLIRLPPCGRCLRPDRNRYSVMAKAARRAVQVRAYADRIVVRCDDEVVAEHQRFFGRDRMFLDPWHYLPVLARKPGALRNGAPFQDWELPPALHAGSFLPGRRNIVLVGGTGTGKTHLAIAITASVVRAGARGRYFNTVDLVNRLEEEARLGKAGALAAQLTRLDLVVLDELGYLPFARSGGQLLFHLVSKLYEPPR